MEKIKHYIYIPFTGLGPINDGFPGQEWFEHRENTFEKMTLKSLANQTNKNFTVWISFRRQEEGNPTVIKMAEAIKKTGLDYIFTFDGIMMYDDRGTLHNLDLKERMIKSLNALKTAYNETEWVYKTDCGSDDMLAMTAVAEIQREEPRIKGATYYLNGYIYNVETDQIADWNRDSACSKYTVIYPASVFYNGAEHLQYLSGLQSHEFLPIVMDATRLPDGQYCCTVHGKNISTTWTNSYRGEEYFDEEKQLILKKFGL